MEEFAVKIHKGLVSWESAMEGVLSQLDFKRVKEMREGTSEERDICHENLLLFTRLGVQFVGLYKATRRGKVGVVQSVMDSLGPQFLGAKQHKYAWELFEVGCGFKKEWTKELQHIVKWNWVINVSGRPGHFLALDEYMEELIRGIKVGCYDFYWVRS